MLDAFLDRRLIRDDGRGLGQGVFDNRETINTFELLFEARHPRTFTDNSLTGYPTLLAHHLSIELLYPMHVFHHLTSHSSVNQLNLFAKSSILPSDYHLVNLRTLNNQKEDRILIPSNRFALILRRFAYDCDSSSDQLEPVLFFLFFLSKIQKPNLFFSQHSNISLTIIKFNQSNKRLSLYGISNKIFLQHLN